MDKSGKSFESLKNQELLDMVQISKYPFKTNKLKLPKEVQNELTQFVAAIKNRRRVAAHNHDSPKAEYKAGLAALFAGSSGTGKTMAAQIIANELELDLYKVDLSQVVSKYIGETEKNLEKIFEEAEKSGAILFFDEADALFGKRTEVKDSNDKFSIIEVSYLLDRIEQYDVLALIAVNNKNITDNAFTRRIRFVIHFPIPDASQRKPIWKKIFAKKRQQS